MQEELLKEYYWEIEKWDGEKIPVKPQNAKLVQDKIASKEGSINTPTRSIVVKDIKDFYITDRIYTEQKLLEGAAHAFDEPIIYEDGSIDCRWVKKSVPSRKWDNYYRYGSYRKIEDNDNFVVVAFRVPVHLINSRAVTEMTSEEVLTYHL